MEGDIKGVHLCSDIWRDLQSETCQKQVKVVGLDLADGDLKSTLVLSGSAGTPQMMRRAVFLAGNYVYKNETSVSGRPCLQACGPLSEI